MTSYARVRKTLQAKPRTWLITGMGGFIGSHLLEALLELDQRVVGLDNFSTGTPRNLADVRARVGEEKWARFDCREGTVADIGTCRDATLHVDFVLHQAGFVSVPLSIEDPLACHDTNVTGTLNMLIAARDSGVKRFVYASSSAAYGDAERMPKIESELGRSLSPYGASKVMAELYAAQFAEHYALHTIGLRYFNVFGPRQNPFGGYAAVIPGWIMTLLRSGHCEIHGSGAITRDFCHVADVVQANLLAAVVPNGTLTSSVYNIARGETTTLDELYRALAEKVATLGIVPHEPRYGPPRAGDIQASGADISNAREGLGFEPEVKLEDGLEETVRWFADHAAG
jgi:UDP-N-acetylglucosamine/UDP-N-acetyl-alpha-D-glucosaminouronate 4-epimerase